MFKKRCQDLALGRYLLFALLAPFGVFLLLTTIVLAQSAAQTTSGLVVEIATSTELSNEINLAPATPPIISPVLPTVTAASSPTCGSITDLNGNVIDITDCSNPFMVTEGENPFSLFISDIAVSDGGTAMIPGTTTNQYRFELRDNRWDFFSNLYQHTAAGYIEVDMSFIPAVALTDEEISAALEVYFADKPDIELYRQVFELENIDALTEAQTEIFFDFIDWLNEGEPTRPKLPLGTYTSVFTKQIPCLNMNEPSFFIQLRNFLVPTAWAFACNGADEVYSITFTLEQAPVEPAGASSVLFLPGFQASRLYEETIGGNPIRHWTPLTGNNVRQLNMDSTGNSVNNIFTEDVLDSVFGLGTVYQNFLASMDNLVATEVISDYESYAYDWRYDVFNIVNNGTKYRNEIRKLQSTVESLAADSYSGQVTIIGHSNGGLLGKALITELEAQGKVALIDSFIMIATPQLGTPKTIASMLHGMEQAIRPAGLVTLVSEETMRAASVNMPGAYGLLPGGAYLNLRNEPLIEFIPGTSTQSFVASYGNSIDSAFELDQFLRDTAGGRAAAETAAEAVALNAVLLDNAQLQRVILDEWTPPATVATYALVGTGRNTIRGVRYESFTERQCFLLLFDCREIDLYKPIPLISTEGDQTVMMVSAAADDDRVKKYYVDLDGISNNLEREFIHYNITEAEAVQQLVVNLIKNSVPVPIEFITDVPVLIDAAQVMIGAHSPVNLYIEDDLGRRTGFVDERVIEEVPGTEFIKLGNSQYVFVPKEIDFTINIDSYDNGGMTMTVSDLTASEQTMRHKIPVAVITASTTIEVRYQAESLENLRVDEDGDGEINYEVSKEGIIIPVASLPVTYEMVTTYIAALDLRSRHERPLLRLLNVAERFSWKSHKQYFQRIERRVLNQTIDVLMFYERRSILGTDDYNILLKYVADLKELSKS